MTESIHPGDPYNAAIYASDCIFYFENPFPVQHDGRFYLKQFRTKFTDLKGTVLENEILYEKYLCIILQRIASMLIYD